jgi:large subunit ribosomal protein L21
MKETTAESYAIIQTGGKQYQAVAGKTIAIEKLNVEAGENVTFNEVLLRKTVGADGKEVIEVGQPFLKTPVTATIVKHIRGPKLVVFHFKRRKKYKRKTGHRQPYTIVRIATI